MKHLPECPNHCINVPADYMERDVYMRRCICEKLRACEQRMLDDGLPAAANHGQRGYEIGYAAALDAAREAVKYLQHSDDCYYAGGDLCHCEMKPVIEAVRALKEK